MKRVLLTVVSLLFVVSMVQTGFTGDLDGPDWGPQSGGGMYSLADLYYYITEGTTFTATTSFTEPAQGPTVPTNMDLKTFGDDIQAMYDQCNLTVDDLAGKGLTGKVFFANSTTDWGPVTVMATPTPIPTPTPPPTPTPVGYWYQQYGPSGTGDVIEIGSMDVASSKDGTGCAGNGTKIWDTACSWGNGLDWLGKTDWRLPNKDEMVTICSNKASLPSYQAARYWSSTTSSVHAYCVIDVGCGADVKARADAFFVRAVRTN